MTSEILHADLVLWACGHVREQLAALAARYPVAAGVEVTNREPDANGDAFPAKLVVIRDDSGPTLSVVSQEKTLGVSTLARTVEDLADASLLARIVFAILSDCAAVAPGNPVASVSESNGPYLVEEDQPRARFYSTHTLVVTGQLL